MCCVIYKCYLNRVLIIRWLPVVAEYIIAGWTYYVYVVAMCLLTSQLLMEKIILLVVYHFLLLMAVWCHAMAVFSRFKKPPQEFYFDEVEWYKLNHEYLWIQRREQMERMRLALGIKTTQTSTGQGLIVYCQQCKMIKPDRCHHCSRCGVCVLKMDHHCPWINNCVGFHNYKYFLLFTFYTMLYCIYVSVTSLKFVAGFFEDVYNGVDVSADTNRIQVVVMFVAIALVGIALFPLFKLHLRLVCNNMTTLEDTRPVATLGKPPDPRIFDIGWRENMQQTFGYSKLLWCIPVFTSEGDGAHFPLREEEILESVSEALSHSYVGKQSSLKEDQASGYAISSNSV